jgi:hypothetical protein
VVLSSGVVRSSFPVFGAAADSDVCCRRKAVPCR